ncbi:N-acetyllactosaminide beta-1,3-N-acetylglucosaminyltransferase 4-like [Paramacrobiotus metropolitanus]|uniref:N-acetyllactosaminide beta-1,3-N-acetylglucosaminyltransferase 4-like n=1 Tax=Paramacrobiotus metropolitanus TaxID=2943436 RepID=UPI002445B86F|nr:N-acetyllactosaminide beta-1,3-N-acetylglucosaminyltransferase 4-like [Paramacrobiotus metropolitanus]
MWRIYRSTLWNIRKNTAGSIFLIILLLCVAFCILLLDSHRPTVTVKNRTTSTALADPGLFFVDPKSVQRQYTISPKPCEPGIFLVVAVITAPRNAGIRAMIRRTWGSLAGSSCQTRMLFMLGRVHSTTTQQLLEEEAREHGDLLQSSQFDDTFRSSTIKTLHLYQWCAAHCSTSTFIVRVDDDAYLNIPKIYDILKDQPPDAFYGHVYKQEILNDEWFPQRNPSEKYYSPREEYSHDRYPVYIWGFLIIAPTALLGKILHASQFIPYSFIDDIYVTGLVANYTGIPLRHIAGITKKTKTISLAQPCLKNKHTAIHKMGQKDLYVLWNAECAGSRNSCN